MDPANIALRLRRVLLSGIVGLALLIPASVIPWPGSAATCAAATTHRVAVVVQHLDGATTSRCVSFAPASITAKDALDGSKIDWRGSDGYAGLGSAVCQVQGEPATYDPSNCLKSSQSFWALFVARDGGVWQPSSQGVSSLTLHGGDAFGLRYQPQAIPLIPPSIAGDCPDPTPPPATPKPTPRPTTPPTSRPTATTTARPSTSASASPVATDGASAPPAATPSPSDGGLAVASGSPEASGMPEAAATSAAPSAPSVGAPTQGGDPPLGLVLVAVAGLAFAALGVLHIRRST